MGLKQEYQFQVILDDLAKSLAAVANAPWERVKLLYSYCPQISDDRFTIYSYSMDCIIALGKYYIQSNFCHTDKIVPYLLNLLKGLITANWCHEHDCTEVPYAEKFSFCLNTLLSEISVTITSNIFIYQTNEIANVYSNIIIDLRNGFENSEQEKHFYAVKLPLFFGLAQSMTRYCKQDGSFFCNLFPKNKEYVGIIHHIKANYESPHLNLVSMICKRTDEAFLKTCSHTFTRQRCDYSSEDVMHIMKLVHSLLSEEILFMFKKRSKALQQSQSSILYFYLKHFNEIVKCAALILYRDVVYQTTDFSNFIDGIKDFVDRIYLSVKTNDVSTHIESGIIIHEENALQKLKINVLTKVTCVELLGWTVKDTGDAENLCLHITSSLKFKETDSRVIIINAPYTIACMDTLGTLTEKFPNVFDVCVKALQDFLSSPSSTLINLSTNQSVPTNDDTFMENELISKSVWFEYCLFKKVQNSAIENLCTTLKSKQHINDNYISVFLTKFSSLLYTEKNHPHYGLIIENVVVSLGHISYSMPMFSLTILQCFQQRLCRHSIESDIAIMHQLANMLTFNNNMDIFLGVLKIFSNMLLEVNNDTKKELQHISKHLFHVLLNIGGRLQGHEKIVLVFVKSLEIFVQTGLDELRSSHALSTQDKEYPTSNRRSMLHLIGLLASKLGSNNKFKKQQERLFQDFWLFFLLRNNESLILECNEDVDLEAIVPTFPTLTSECLTDHDLRECFYTASLNKIGVRSAKVTQLKTQLLNFFNNNTEIVLIVNKLSFPQIIYLHSVFALEIIRIKSSDEPSIEYLFCYLTNVKLQKDRYGIWQCLCKAADEIFARFLTRLRLMKRNDSRESILEKQVLILLINFNNVHFQIRHIADKFLSELIDAFPHLLWNRQVLWNVLDIVAVLHYSLIISSNNQTASLKIPNTDYTIFLMDTKKSREEIFNDFVARSREIICEARKWAPDTINSHLQQYIIRDDYLFQKIDPICDVRHSAWTLLWPNDWSNNEISAVIKSVSMRSRFIGEVAGLMEKSGLPPNEFGKHLAEDVWNACENQDLLNYQICLQRATAFAIMQRILQYEIKQVLSRSHVKFFTEETVSTVVHCWNWMCTVHPEFELELLIEMFEVLQYTVEKRMGLFSGQNADNDDCTVQNISHPHNTWIEFIAQQMLNAKYACQDKLDMIIYFLHNTLPMSIGSSDCIMSRNVENIVGRFSLLSSALALLQYDIPITSTDRSVLRQRIYCSCLDYFCCLRKFPCKNGLQLKQKLDILEKFWHILYSDKKHLLKYFTPREHKTITPTAKNDEEREKRFTTIASMKGNSLDSVILYDSFSIDIFKKRKLALCLIAEEIEFLSTWQEPSRNAFRKIKQWQSSFFSANKSMSEFCKTAWYISPVLSVYLPLRLRRDERIAREMSKLILSNPEAVCHIPHAMTFLATVENVQNDREELVHLLTWAEAEPLAVISLLSRNYSPHPIVLQYVTKKLLNFNFEGLGCYIPQLVQSIRYDTLGYVHKLLFSLAQKCQLLCHQLIWNMKSNMYNDINMINKSTLFNKLNDLMNDITSVLSGPAKVFYEREFEFVHQITDVSSKIPKNLKRAEKRLACLNALKSIKLSPGCYLPSSPEALLCDIDYSSGTPLQSKTRTPYLVNFLVCKCTHSDVHDIGMQISKKQMAGHLEWMDTDALDCFPKEWQRTIFKAADDVRQDVLALQTIQYMKNLFQRIGLDLFLFPYRVVAVAPSMGVIECIPNAYSRDQLGKQTNVGLYDYFVTTFGDEKSARFQEAQRNFIKSVAAYSVVIFLLQIKDRHNGNIMVDDEGHIIHIDFGFMFESSPGGNLGFEPDMKLTEEMVMIMGGRMESEPFQWFTELCVKAYLAVRCYQEDIITLVTLMLDSGLPCFRGQTIKLLRGRFAPNASDRDASDYITTVIRNSYMNFRTVTYDMLQYLQNSIQY